MIKDTSETVANEVYDGYVNVYSMLTVSLKFRRRTLFFSFNLVLPSIIITVCSIFGFILPPDSGEKIGLRNYFMLYFLLMNSIQLKLKHRNNKSSWCIVFSAIRGNYSATIKHGRSENKSATHFFVYLFDYLI